MLDDNELQKLLRLKRHEQPPPEYFEKFLHEFHRRQRADLLRQPLWKMAAERVVAFFSESTASSFGYAGATALVLLCAGMASFQIVRPPREKLIVDTFPAAQRFTLRPQVQLPVEFSDKRNASAIASLRPRYVMDARPVSYEPASSF